MEITVVGCGYVGLVTGTCLADTGNHVLGLDIDQSKIDALNRGECPIFEPGLTELLQTNLSAQRLKFTSDPDEAVASTEVIFLCVGTPPKDDGSADLTIMRGVAADLAKRLRQDVVVVIKSTVPVGTCESIEELMQSNTAHQVNVVSNPEFLKEGSAVDDFLRPDRVVIGANNVEAGKRVEQLYLPYVRNNKPILTMSRRASEMTKYAANAFLATRISFINEMANICDQLEIDVSEVRQGMGTDSRIGFQFLYPGCGYGGSCFPKDVQAIAAFARAAGYEPQILDAVHQLNERQKQLIFHKMMRRFDNALSGKIIALWGGAFKPKTDDIREAPAVTLINQLLEAGATVRVHDPQAIPNLTAEFGERIATYDDPYEVAAQVDALAVVTEWNEFRNPNFRRLHEVMRQPIIFDGRNLYDSTYLRTCGFEHFPIGRPAVRG